MILRTRNDGRGSTMIVWIFFMLSFASVCGILRHFMLQERKAMRHLKKAEEKVDEAHRANRAPKQPISVRLNDGGGSNANAGVTANQNTAIEEPLEESITLDFGD